ncbi:MAG: UPF0182 family protein [Elainellaceae cyanobacterium]
MKSPLKFQFNQLLPLLLLVAIVLLLGLGSLVHLVTEYWWFSAVGFAPVFRTRLAWQVGIGVVTALVYGVFVLGNYWLAKRLTRHRIFRILVEGGRWQTFPESLPGYIALALAVAIALVSVASTMGQWETLLKFFNATPFNFGDPIYGQDVGFYVFRLPVLHLLKDWLLSLLVWGLIVAALVYGFKGELTLGRGWRNVVTGGARAHLSVLLMGIAGVTAFGFWLERYDLLYSSEGVVFGAGFTDVHARLQSYWIMGAATLVLALLLLASLWRQTAALPIVGTAAYVALLIIVGGVYPWFQQSFLVEPNELVKETPYIKHNIEFTRAAYDLSQIESRDYPAETNLSAADIDRNASTIKNIRLWDYRPLLSTYRQLQEIRPYYSFPDVDVDRYTLGGNDQQVMIAPRELDYSGVPPEAQTWVNQRLKYTHGYGVAMSPVNRVSDNGLPAFFIQDIPPVSTIDREVEQPGIYYGEVTDTYVFTGTTTQEFDYPRDDKNALVKYDGAGGVPMPSPLHRLAYAYDLGSLKILISNYFTPNSRIHYHRPILERVKQVAPFLRFDDDPYITLIDGRLQWILDAYTVSDRFPYAQPVRQSADAGAVFSEGNVRQILRGGVNYLRNSAKVVIDAYDGTMRFLVVDESDPVLATYRNIFPTLFESGDIPPAVRDHFRYPVDLFKIQAQMYLSYHMTDSEEFYNREDLWRFPLEQYEDRQQVMQPYYVNMRLPEATEDEFILILPFTPVNKDNMIAWMAARSDGEQYGNVLLYEFPKQELIYGPSQIEARIDQNPEISQQLTLWSQEGSRVIRGDLLVIPIERSLLYVEPIYLRAEQGELPELRRVIVSYGNQTVMEPSLQGALRAIFGADILSDSDEDEVDAIAPSGPTSSAADPSAPTQDSASLAPAAAATPSLPVGDIQAALEAYENAQEALRQGNWTDYGRYQRELGEQLEQLQSSADDVSSNADNAANSADE